ncbi:hypothetical protein ASE19_23850 [Nocardioides sp. Root79]|nr:hypothetical protein ASE19_23850 [Nocardioides sp. Root79]KRC74207.1 hypothetical protein ASE20_23810 [Nocardioides sp. Root240]
MVIEENHSRDQMLAQMPHLARLAHRYGMATRWSALVHPSEPNYLAIVGGSMFSVTDDRSPSRNAPKVGPADNVFARAIRAGRTARTYAESMPSPCALENHGDYAVRHNPWTYFPADRRNCARFDVSTQHFADDARSNRLPDVGLLVPNLVHDAHDGSLAAADEWLAASLAPVLASTDFRTGRLVVVVTADEDDRHAGNTVLTAVLTPWLRHKVVDRRLDHYSLHRFMAELVGVDPLANGVGARDMRGAFGL